jgi:N-acyl-D-aspartate/D-glutamate deacylase
LASILAGACTGLSGQPGESASRAAPTYDLVITGGRAIDPESGLDEVVNVAIAGDRIAAISGQPLSGSDVIDANGLVVAPGFIDIHNHSPTPLGLRYQAFDGVTTTLELEAGAHPVSEYANPIRGKAPIHYGASAGVLMARMAVLTDFRQTDLSVPPVMAGDGSRPLMLAFSQHADAEQIEAIRRELVASLDQGAIGIGLPLDYASVAIGKPELDMIFLLAAQREVPVFVHVRRGLAGDPTGLEEAISLAREHGARTLICHLSHNAIQNTADFLERVRAARREGVDVHAEVMPYNAGSVFIGAAVFGRDWRSVFGIDYGDIQLARTGEWLTRESFERLRREDPQAQVMHHYLREEWTRLLVAAPDVIVSSDGLTIRSPEENIPPQGVGTFAKLLGTYVRDEQVTDLQTALTKITLMPAQLLEDGAPAFRFKGRLQVGMDADITIFDPATIASRATYTNAHQPSVGVHHVIVGGVPVIRDSQWQDQTTAGQQILAKTR